MAEKPKKQSNKGRITGLIIFIIVILFLGYYGVLTLYSNNETVEISKFDNIIVLLTSLLISIALVILVILIYQSKTNKNRCPKCKMVNDYIVIRQKEISHDTQMVTKKVQKKIRDTKGQILKTTEEIAHVTVVNSVIQQQRKCKNCYHLWDITINKHIEY